MAPSRPTDSGAKTLSEGPKPTDDDVTRVKNLECRLKVAPVDEDQLAREKMGIGTRASISSLVTDSKEMAGIVETGTAAHTDRKGHRQSIDSSMLPGPQSSIAPETTPEITMVLTLAQPDTNRGIKRKSGPGKEVSKRGSYQIKNREGHRHCSTCDKLLPPESFDGTKATCKECLHKKRMRKREVERENARRLEISQKHFMLKPMEDGYRWQKYASKVINKNSNEPEFIRKYYRCMHSGCTARKFTDQIQVGQDGKQEEVVTHADAHTHTPQGAHITPALAQHGAQQAQLTAMAAFLKPLEPIFAQATRMHPQNFAANDQADLTSITGMASMLGWNPVTGMPFVPGASSFPASSGATGASSPMLTTASLNCAAAFPPTVGKPAAAFPPSSNTGSGSTPVSTGLGVAALPNGASLSAPASLCGSSLPGSSNAAFKAVRPGPMFHGPSPSG